MKTFEDHAKELLALAWARFDAPLWSARYDVEQYLRENFVPKAIYDDIVSQSKYDDLSLRNQRAFVEALMNPPEPNESLREDAKAYMEHVCNTGCHNPCLLD